ncbi:MAG: DUF362 domain-containing protein [Candidatus Bathyarchaeota archaeon]|nr:DUF362 domain-containing protein [Candidatus Bathyarchaeota archaeon]
MDTVAFLKFRESFKETLQEAINLIGGIKELESPLILKPNICTGNDHTGCANVNVEVVEALVDHIIRENRDIEIRIVESDSMSKYADKAFKRYGYMDYVDRLSSQGVNISLHNLSNSPLTQFNYEGYYFKNPELPVILADAGALASVALAKTHSLTMITGVLKNLFGLLPRKDQAFYHPKIHEVILDLNSIFRSSLCLIDGRMGLEGVISGNPRSLGCIILGRNPVSVDATMARAMGFDPEKIRHIVEAERHGLGSLHPKVVGDDLEASRVEFKTPSGLKTNALIR